MDSDQTIEALARRERKTERSIHMTLSLTFLYRSPSFRRPLQRRQSMDVSPAALEPSG
jgi:hypothetical protein